MKLKFPTVNCPVRTVSISDLWKGNESCSARLPSVRQGSKCYSCQGGGGNYHNGRSGQCGEERRRLKHKGITAATKLSFYTEAAV